MATNAVQQYEIPERVGYDAIFDAHYLVDIHYVVSKWQCDRVVLVASKTLDTETDYVQRLAERLGNRIVAKKTGVGSHSPYKDVIEIAHLLQQHNADCLISMGSSSYSDACKIAAQLQATMKPGFDAQDMEAMVDQKRGAGVLKAAIAKVILVPTSLSASEWNGTGSCTNGDGKKQHFGVGSHLNGAPHLIVLDPEVASTAPETLWLSSGVRCIDHCVETMCSLRGCTPEASKDAESGLRDMIKGLKEYKDGKGHDREEFLRGVSECQKGSRQSIKGLIVHRSPFGPSHAIGHQLGSVAGVMHGVTSCILLAPVLKHIHKDTKAAQARVLDVFNSTLGWEEEEAGTAVTRFVKLLGLPTTLNEVGVTDEAMIRKIAEKTLTDVWGGQGAQITDADEIMDILNMAR